MKPTESRKRYNDYPAYFKELFGERVQKLSIDGGFTCPNRDGKKGTGGCTFCNNESFNPGYCRAVSGISRQIGEGRAFFARKYIGNYFFATLISVMLIIADHLLFYAEVIKEF